MADINNILQTKANLYTPNARVDATNLVGFNGNPSLIVEPTPPAVLTVGERALLNAAVTSLYCNNDGTYYVKTPAGWEELGGSGGTFSGDNIVLETLDSNWRIINDDPYLKFQRRLNDGTDTWRTYASMGSSISTDGIILTRPYQISYDLANTLDSDALPDLAEVITLSGVDTNIVYGNSNQQTILNTKRGSNILTAHTLADQFEIENRPLTDKTVKLDRRETPDAGSLPEMAWVSDINFSQGEISYIRFKELGFDVVDCSDPVNGVPMRISVEDLDGNLIQETVSRINLDAGVKNAIKFKPGFDFYQINPSYEERQNAKTITRLVVQEGHWVELKAGEYSYQDETDTTQVQDVPYQKSIVEFFELGVMMAAHNFNKVLGVESGVNIRGGNLQLRLDSPELGIDETHHIAGVSEHVDIRNVQIGNFYDKTYVNSGNGGIWSIVEESATRAEFLLTREYDSRNDGVTTDDHVTLMLDYVRVDIKGQLSAEFDLLDNTWNTVNLYGIKLFGEYTNADPLVTELNYRTAIRSHSYEQVLQESETDWDFRNNNHRNGFAIPVNPNPGVLVNMDIALPNGRYTLNNDSERYIDIYFKEPVAISGWYDNPVDPLDPQPDEFVPVIKLDVVKAVEEEILTGSSIEDKLNEIVGSEEYREATERDLNTLHIDPEGKQVLADKSGEWIYFWNNIGSYEMFDKHQYIYRSGREVIYKPNSTCFEDNGLTPNSDNYLVADPLVVHIDSPSNVQYFNVSLLIDEDIFASEAAGSNGIEFTFWINTYQNANTHSITVSVPWNYSIQYQYTMDRNNLYTYRAQLFEDNLASTVAPLLEGSELDSMPVDPNL